MKAGIAARDGSLLSFIFLLHWMTPPVDPTELYEASSSSSIQVQLTCSSDCGFASSEDTRTKGAVSHCRYMAQRRQEFQQKRPVKDRRPCPLCNYDGAGQNVRKHMISIHD